MAQSEKDLEMERMLEHMKSMGMGGSLYNKDDMGEMMGMDGYEDEELGGLGASQEGATGGFEL